MQWQSVSLPTPLAVQAVPSAAVNRSMLYATFVDLYVPKNCQAQNDHFAFFKTCIDLPAPHPALLNGLDALSLVQLGSSHNDRRLLREASSTFGRALGSLQRALVSPESLQDDHLLAAIMVLKVCEFYTGLASAAGVGWEGHVQGMERLLATRGPGSLKTPFGAELLAHARHASLCHALIARKAPCFAQPMWRAAVRTQGKEASENLHDIAIQVPGILEEHDLLIHHSPDTDSDIDAVLAKAGELEAGLRAWLSEHSNPGQYELQPIDHFLTFSTSCADRTFPTAYMFPDFRVAYLHAIYWLCTYFLLSTLQALQVTKNSAVGRSSLGEQRVDERELLDCIHSICRCIPFFCEPTCSATGIVATFLPLRTAAQYFRRREMRAELRWVGNVSKSVFSKGLSPPSVDPMKLKDFSYVKVEEVSPS